MGQGLQGSQPTSAPAHNVQSSPPRRTPQPCWILMLWCSQSLSALQVPMLTLGIQPSVESSVETSFRHTLGAEAEITSGLCLEAKCVTVAKSVPLRIRLEEDFCWRMFPMLEINYEFFQLSDHPEDLKYKYKLNQPNSSHFKETGGLFFFQENALQKFRES